jgi:hypothetical protein
MVFAIQRHISKAGLDLKPQLDSGIQSVEDVMNGVTALIQA